MLNNKARDIILHAAMEVIAESSNSNASLQKIADRAGIKQPNIHYYFDTRKDLLLALMIRMQEAYDELLDEYVDKKDSLEEQLSGFFFQEEYSLKNEPEFIRCSLALWGLSLSDPDYRERYSADYNTWRERIMKTIHTYVPEIPDEKCLIIASQTISLTLGCSIQHLVDPDKYDLHDYMKSALEMILETIDRERAKYSA